MEDIKVVRTQFVQMVDETGVPQLLNEQKIKIT